MKPRTRILPVVVSLLLGLGAWAETLPGQVMEQTTITFDEPQQRTPYNGGFNGHTNYYLISSDGKFRVEAFCLYGTYWGYFYLYT